jgi:D-alanyl-D-alanine carboxypeptidase
LKKFIAILIILIFNTGVYALEPSDISAECAVLVEGKTQSVLFAKNEQKYEICLIFG